MTDLSACLSCGWECTAKRSRLLRRMECSLYLVCLRDTSESWPVYGFAYSAAGRQHVESAALTLMANEPLRCDEENWACGNVLFLLQSGKCIVFICSRQGKTFFVTRRMKINCASSHTSPFLSGPQEENRANQPHVTDCFARAFRDAKTTNQHFPARVWSRF